jgi:hypothetical protein
MVKRYAILLLAGTIVYAWLALPSAAQEESWSFGGGWWSLPNVGDSDVDTSGMYASAAIDTLSYRLELDYAIGEPNFLALAADYLYPLNAGAGYFGGSGFVGLGYTYFSADDLENESGFNVIGGAAVGESLRGTIRYDFLGSDEELFTIGLSYSFF